MRRASCIIFGFNVGRLRAICASVMLCLISIDECRDWTATGAHLVLGREDLLPDLLVLCGQLLAHDDGCYLMAVDKMGKVTAAAVEEQ